MTQGDLSLEAILFLHFSLIEDYGGTHGVRDEGRLKSVVQAPHQVVFGKPQYPTVLDKAAVYMRNIVGDHPFTDGNKRTALAVCGVFLKRNGLALIADGKEAEDFVVRVATDSLSIGDIKQWLEENTQRSV